MANQEWPTDTPELEPDPRPIDQQWGQVELEVCTAAIRFEPQFKPDIIDKATVATAIANLDAKIRSE
jgi:hypothetical protein